MLTKTFKIYKYINSSRYHHLEHKKDFISLTSIKQQAYLQLHVLHHCQHLINSLPVQNVCMTFLSYY